MACLTEKTVLKLGWGWQEAHLRRCSLCQQSPSPKPQLHRRGGERSYGVCLSPAEAFRLEHRSPWDDQRSAFKCTSPGLWEGAST